MASKKSLGVLLAERLHKANQYLNRAPKEGARSLHVLQGLTPQGVATVPLENVLAEAQTVIVESGRVFSYGGGVYWEDRAEDEARLAPLTSGDKSEQTASAILANLLVCESTDQQGNLRQFAPPGKIVSAILNREPTRQALPRVRQYARRPVFDEHFVLKGPGWHAEAGILVHGIAVEPIFPAEKISTDVPALQRLPMHLQAVLRDFCFQSDADLANAVGALLTGLLITHFISGGKPVVILDGNQPGVGKTLLARTIGMILDGADPRVIHYSADDEELQKRICATLRGSTQSLVVVDNAKVKGGAAISSATIESNSMAPVISLRILGTSENYTQPNDVLWVLTMNDTKTSPDLVSRALPIRLRLEGQPEGRRFDGRDPVEYARKHRGAILGELAGMVYRWNTQGRPDGEKGHRLAEWAKVVGGILTANGLPEALANLAEAASEFNAGLDDLAALAEGYLANGMGGSSEGFPAAEWRQLFLATKVAADKLEHAKSQKAIETIIGAFLGRHVDRPVPVQANSRTGTATLRMRLGRSKAKRYHFDVSWDSPAIATSPFNASEDSAGMNGQGGSKSASSARLGALNGPLASDPLARPPGGNQERWNGEHRVDLKVHRKTRSTTEVHQA